MTDTASAVTDQVPEMVERVARAIIDTANTTPLFRTREAYYRHLARTAIEAMREPTAAMLGATRGSDIYTGQAELAWQAMIEAALG